ncbi:GntR family transcriptional regulator [Cellulosilyticum sp. I15G10I2]|uniref:GntR family transcriptional regulator n=1 Tax=Cellulosilyticum sp. I15G10I2 TaxID=1892843 RepID=UPI00085CD6F1|nr:GntR family transcriptional regulator [Cellulosilyticum sp. I15G10I2]
MANDLLYMTLKNNIMRKIYKGIYNDGEILPSERVLAQQHNMSRDTVRKALNLLEADGIIERKLGKGSVVSLRQQSYNGNLDIIALVAPAQRSFFATFIDHFQKVADQHHSLIVFIQQSEHESLDDTLFKLLLNNIHNVVIWLDYETISSHSIKRLRGLGMNIVFFDITVNSPYADCVCLDNRDAISSLYQYVSAKSNKGIAYITRENTTPSSYQEREHEFERLSPTGSIWSFPWDFKNYRANKTDKFSFEYFYQTYKPDSVICSDGDLAIALKKTLIKSNIDDILLVSLDDFEECEELGITVYKQPYNLFAQKIFACLQEQNFNHLNWKAHIYRVKGALVVR